MAKIIIVCDELMSLQELYALMDKINHIVNQEHKSSVKEITFEL